MSDATFILVTAASAVLLAMVLIGVIYLKFKDGIATTIYLLVVPVFAIVGITGVIVGRVSATLPGLFIGEAFLLPPMIGCLWLLYRQIVKKMGGHGIKLSANASQISDTAKQAAGTAMEQSTSMAEVSSTIEEINQTSKASAASAQDVVKVAESAVEAGQKGLEAVARASDAMKLFDLIAEIVETVNELAEQSNLLALNASIEAAKAGEHGRGFAVVASEVRSLAEQSKEATHRIREAIKKADQGRLAVGDVGSAMDRLVAVLDESASKSRQIAAAATQQAAGVKQIAGVMSMIAEGGRDTAVGAKQLEQATLDLNSISLEINRLIFGKAAETAAAAAAAKAEAAAARAARHSEY